MVRRLNIAIFPLLVVMLLALLGVSYHTARSVEKDYQTAYDVLTTHRDLINRMLAESAKLFRAAGKTPPDMETLLFESRVFSVHLKAAEVFDEAALVSCNGNKFTNCIH